MNISIIALFSLLGVMAATPVHAKTCPLSRAQGVRIADIQNSLVVAIDSRTEKFHSEFLVHQLQAQFRHVKIRNLSHLGVILVDGLNGAQDVLNASDYIRSYKIVTEVYLETTKPCPKN